MFWKKKKEVTDADDKINNKMVEEIVLKCSCGNEVLREESDIFMVGFEAYDDIEDFQTEYSAHCDYCNKLIHYEDLDNKSKGRFNEVVGFFINEIH